MYYFGVLLSFQGTSEQNKQSSNFYGSFSVHKSRRSKLGRWFEVDVNVACKHPTSHNIPSALHSSSPEPWCRHFPPTITEHMVGSSPAPMNFSLNSLSTSVIHMKMSLSLSLCHFSKISQIWFLRNSADWHEFFVEHYSHTNIHTHGHTDTGRTCRTLGVIDLWVLFTFGDSLKH